MTDESPLGLYIHVPFCAGGKCPYCDFYSLPVSASSAAQYETALKAAVDRWAEKTAGRAVDTVYFGGGTPTVLGEGLARLLLHVKKRFCVTDNAEITFEANPTGLSAPLLRTLADAGFNRLSLGMQSADSAQLRLLGRRHSADDVENAASAAKAAGINNISLDMMICLPGQTEKEIEKTVFFAAALGPRHISAYMLTLEDGTPFAREAETLGLPGEERQRELYLFSCEALEQAGFNQYEISNFARPGYESRHNLKYWRCGEYLGLGPAAHSFLNGRRFYYEKNLRNFCAAAGADSPVVADEGPGGGFEEFCMLALRLCRGIRENELKARFGRGFEAFDEKLLRKLAAAGLAETDGKAIRLTKTGFLVSNSVISLLIF